MADIESILEVLEQLQVNPEDINITDLAESVLEALDQVKANPSDANIQSNNAQTRSNNNLYDKSKSMASGNVPYRPNNLESKNAQIKPKNNEISHHENKSKIKPLNTTKSAQYCQTASSSSHRYPQQINDEKNEFISKNIENKKDKNYCKQNQSNNYSQGGNKPRKNVPITKQLNDSKHVETSAQHCQTAFSSSHRYPQEMNNEKREFNSKNITNKKDNKQNQSNNYSQGGNKSGKNKSYQNDTKSRLGYKKLEELLQSNPEDIALQLANPYNGFEYLLAEEKYLDSKPDWVVLITKLLTKVCTSQFPENRTKVLITVCESTFLNCCHKYLVRFNPNKTRLSTLEAFLRDVLEILNTLANVLPSMSKERFHDIVKSIFGSICMVEELNDFKVESEIKGEYKYLENRLRNMESMSLTMADKTNCHLDEGEPPDDFRTISLYPMEEEILSDGEVFLRRSIVNGKYESIEHYLDIQFRLLRQDLVAPLREGIKQLIESLTAVDKTKRRQKIQNIRLFRNCSFEAIETDKKGSVSYTVCFDLMSKLKHINWEYNKWFMYGSLLFFSFDNFSSFFMGTVDKKENRICKTKQTIQVKLVGDDEIKVTDFGRECMMVESSIFFQPYYHVMKALQNFDETNFPMVRYIVEVNPVIKPPKYLSSVRNFKIDSFCECDILDQYAWPSASELSLDKYQYEAFQSALTKEFVVMQGPPGTGKTYLGLKIVETLLNQKQLLNHLSSPILLVCYTNHALDQFLEGILKVTNSVVRVGTQTKSEIIKPYELNEKRRFFKFSKSLNSAYISLRQEMEELLFHINRLNNILESLEKKYGIVHLDYLQEFISPAHLLQLHSSEDLVNWLLPPDKRAHHLDLKKMTEENVVTSSENIDSDAEYSESENESDESDEEEARKQLKNEIPLLDDIQFEKCQGIMAVTIGSLDKRMKSVEKEITVIERMEYIDKNLYSRNLSKCESQLECLNNTKVLLKKHLNELLGNYDYKDCSQMKSNLQKMSVKERWRLYDQWVGNFRFGLMQSIRDSELEYRTKVDQFSEARQVQDLEVLLQHKVLGTTTTAAAKYHMMFAALQPKIVVVEEAAEVLEAHIVTALTKACEHLILIGDHQQLRPNPTVFELAKKYNLEVSLFERMIKNKLSFSSLGVQHRMRPEICDLITPTIYPRLENHVSVFDYENVRGVSKNLFFITHKMQEQSDDVMQSYQNSYEAGFVFRLARYLLLQGYSPDEITILTTYSGQLVYMKMERKKMPELRNLRISTVDNYQGEECQIILLSLVRSNPENKIGFLATPNRVCVALSRAKQGFYMIGDIECLENGSEIWPNIKKQLEMHNAIGSELELECIIHKNKTYVSMKEDFSQVLEGGCTSMCNAVLACSHICKSLCHPRDQEHTIYKCGEKCTRQCPDGHPCLNKCFESCNQCLVMVERKLDCGHSVKLECCVDPSEYLCKVQVNFNFELCGHSTLVKCHALKSGEKIKCPKPCEHRLECGHACIKTCHPAEDPDHIEYKCMKDCNRVTKGCQGSHKCKKKCFEQCSLCNERVTKELICGHKQTVICHLDVTYVSCNQPCTKLLSCGHKCEKICVEMCGDCGVEVPKKIPDCGHTVVMKCKVEPSINLCDNPCTKLLNCGHQCSKKCNEICNSGDCVVLVDCLFTTSYCGHPIKVPCKDHIKPEGELRKIALNYCPEPCDEMLLCQHRCGGTCSDCKQGVLHIICKEKCGRVNICGHSCKSDCSALCPPCKEVCTTKCDHSKCNKPCGEKCVPCRERCEWACPHYQCTKECAEFCNRPRCYKKCKEKLDCGHRCIGFCNEPCPDKCRVCDEEEVTEILFGTEDEEDARFVLLEDCGHFIESSAIERIMGITEDEPDTSDATVKMKTCPKCSTPIVSTRRFMNQIRAAMNDVAQVKIIQRGKTRPIATLKLELGKRLQELQQFKREDEANKRVLLNSKYFINIIDRITKSVGDYYNTKVHGKILKKFNYITPLQINLFTFIIDCLENIKNRMLAIQKLGAIEYVMLIAQMDEILFYISDNILQNEKLSEQQQFDLKCELTRFFALANLLEIKPAYSYFKDLDKENILNELYDKIFGEIRCFKKYNDERSKIVDELILDLEKTAKAAVLKPEIERKMIRMALAEKDPAASLSGHWYKCSKGHIYLIGNCGLANQASRCIECKEPVGGTSYHLASTSQHAPEMLNY